MQPLKLKYCAVVILGVIICATQGDSALITHHLLSLVSYVNKYECTIIVMSQLPSIHLGKLFSQNSSKSLCELLLREHMANLYCSLIVCALTVYG